MDIKTLEAQLESLLNMAAPGRDRSTLVAKFNGALTILSAVYGPQSHHLIILRDFVQPLLQNLGNSHFDELVETTVVGALRNLKSELDAGLHGNLEKRITGEVLTDFIQLARTSLDQKNANSINVAAVLAAAAFEDAIRRMGSTLAGTLGDEKLSEVIDALRDKCILQSPQLGIAQSYLKFRNDALHARWKSIEPASVHSILGFIEQLLLKHFS